MKVLFIVPYPTEGQSNRFRVQQYLPYLKAKGIKYSLRPFSNSYVYKVLFKKGYYVRKIIFVLFFIMRRFLDVFRALFHDLVFIHREAYPFDADLFERLFKIFGKKIIYDFDDSVFLKKPLKTRKTIKMSDYVIVGNDFLKNYVLQYNTNVVVLPTCIDTDIYKPRPKTNNDKVVIGWIGTTFTEIYLDMLKDVYSVLSNKHKNLEFRIIGGHMDVKSVPSTCREWSLASEINELQGFDIGVMPLFDDDMAKGKCAFKIIQYMAVGIPSVASKSGMNAQVIDDGKDGFLVSNTEEWINKLSVLIEDKKLRQEIGKFARLKAERLYSIASSKDKFIGILEEVFRA